MWEPVQLEEIGVYAYKGDYCLTVSLSNAPLDFDLVDIPSLSLFAIGSDFCSLAKIIVKQSATQFIIWSTPSVLRLRGCRIHPLRPPVCAFCLAVSLVYINQSARSFTTGFFLHNGNTIDCKIQRTGDAPITVSPGQWSPNFVQQGKYDVFIIDSIIQMTINFGGGSMDILSGSGPGVYNVFTQQIW
jgi:hypothetical protein